MSETIFYTSRFGQRTLIFDWYIVVKRTKIYLHKILAKSCHGLVSDNKDLDNIDSINDYLNKWPSIGMQALNRDNMCL